MYTGGKSILGKSNATATSNTLEKGMNVVCLTDGEKVSNNRRIAIFKSHGLPLCLILFSLRKHILTMFTVSLSSYQHEPQVHRVGKRCAVAYHHRAFQQTNSLENINNVTIVQCNFKNQEMMSPDFIYL